MKHVWQEKTGDERIATKTLCDDVNQEVNVDKCRECKQKENCFGEEEIDAVVVRARTGEVEPSIFEGKAVTKLVSDKPGILVRDMENNWYVMDVSELMKVVRLCRFGVFQDESGKEWVKIVQVLHK